MYEGVHSNKSGQADITLNATRNGNWAIYFMTYFMTSSSAISRGQVDERLLVELQSIFPLVRNPPKSIISTAVSSLKDFKLRFLHLYPNYFQEDGHVQRHKCFAYRLELLLFDLLF